jgi:hypothetical protein
MDASGVRINGIGVKELFEAYWLKFNHEIHASDTNMTAERWLNHVRLAVLIATFPNRRMHSLAARMTFVLKFSLCSYIKCHHCPCFRLQMRCKLFGP